MSLAWMMNYLIWLALFSGLVSVLERLWPARPQSVFRRWLWSDLFHLIFNGHVFGLLIYGIAVAHISPPFERLLDAMGLRESLYFSAVQVWGWGLALQALVAFVFIDPLQWCVHRTLHRVDILWKIHQVHHSVVDGEMDWIVAFRFSWLEPVIYKGLLYLPLAWFGFHPDALFFHAVLGTLIGHLKLGQVIG